MMNLVTPASAPLLLSLIGLRSHNTGPEDPLHLILGVEVSVLHQKHLLGGFAVHGVVTDWIGVADSVTGIIGLDPSDSFVDVIKIIFLVVFTCGCDCQFLPRFLLSFLLLFL